MFYTKFDKLSSNPILGPIFKTVSTIGFYSYGIYLFFVPVYHVIFHELMVLPFQAGSKTIPAWFFHPLVMIWFYFAVAIILGSLLSRLVETPFLAIRDKYYPSATKSNPILTATL
jgi:peptidoglycan/LPS O-acetylase OafA/YrhL